MTTKRKKKVRNRVKVPVYFHPRNEVNELHLLEYCRLASGMEISLANFIKYMAIEKCLDAKREAEDEARQSDSISQSTPENQEGQGDSGQSKEV